MKKYVGTQFAKEKLSTGSDEKMKAYYFFASVFTREASHNMVASNTNDSGVIPQVNAGK